MPMLIFIILALGLCAGSFVNALVWRIHEQTKSTKLKAKDKKNLSIINGRSICPACKHNLAWYDLIPVVSWLVLRGKCRHCAKPISTQYPLVELICGLVFAVSYIFWPVSLDSGGQ